MKLIFTKLDTYRKCPLRYLLRYREKLPEVRQLSELHVLLQQTQAALPPARDGRPRWRRLWARA